MWHVKKLIAVDDAGNTVEVDDGTVTVSLADCTIKIKRSINSDETSPCLHVAVSDLLKIISQMNPSA